MNKKGLKDQIARLVEICNSQRDVISEMKISIYNKNQEILQMKKDYSDMKAKLYSYGLEVSGYRTKFKIDER